jgi:hypothetical protein
VAGLDAIAARDGDGDGLGCDLAIGVWTGGFEEVVRAARIKGGVVIGEGWWSTAKYVVNIVAIFRIN